MPLHNPDSVCGYQDSEGRFRRPACRGYSREMFVSSLRASTVAPMLLSELKPTSLLWSSNEQPRDVSFACSRNGLMLRPVDIVLKTRWLIVIRPKVLSQ